MVWLRRQSEIILIWGLPLMSAPLIGWNMPIHSTQFSVIRPSSGSSTRNLYLKSCYTALRLRGKMGIQAPARNVYSPNFIDAVETVGKDARLSEKFESFEAPWLLLETPEEYEILFQNAGFAVLHAHMERVVSSHTPEEVFKIFDSGASAGYLNQDFYHSPISDDYISGFREVVREAFTRQANPDGQVDLTFFRIYLLALKP